MYYYEFRAALQHPMVVASAYGDVTGDGSPDHVYLTGNQTPESPFIQNITLTVQDGKTHQTTSIPLAENAGYNPTLFLGDITADGVPDILVSIASGGSGGMMYEYVYSFKHQVPRLLFNSQQYNERFSYEVTYEDNRRVEVVSRNNNKKYMIDISGRDPSYLNEIYDENGKLKQPIQGFVNPLSGLYPVDFDSNGVYELLAYQRIAGRYNADSLGYVLNTLSWKENRFLLQNQYVAVFGY